MNNKVIISYFFDILCIWSYISQIRVNELKNKLGENIKINYHFITIFGCTENRINKQWQDKGGYAGFGDYVQKTCKDFPHVAINPDIWNKVKPKSSAPGHLFLKAVQNLEANGDISSAPQVKFNNNTLFEELYWRIQCAFFKDAKDTGMLTTLYDLAEELNLPINKIDEQINNGTAFSSLCADNELRESKKLDGSPTYLLNKGRQKLYGNVGYRIIEANIDELLQRPEDMASWC